MIVQEDEGLYRPTVSVFKGGCVVALVLVVDIVLSIFLDSIVENSKQTIEFGDILIFLIVLELFFNLKHIFIWFILLYQSTAPAYMRLSCLYTPSCSQYSIFAIKRYGALFGSIIALDRLLRCKGPNGGEDHIGRKAQCHFLNGKQKTKNQ